MGIISFSGVMLIIYLDLRNFLRRDPAVFDKVFKFSLREYAMLLIMSTLVYELLIISYQHVPAFLLLLIVSIYAVRRLSCVRLLNGRGLEKEVVVSEAFGVIINWLAIVSIIITIVGKLISLFLGSQEAEFAELMFSTVVSFTVIVYLLIKLTGRKGSRTFLQQMNVIGVGDQIFKGVFFPVLSGLFFAGCSSWIILSRQIQPETPLSEILQSAQSPELIILFLIMALVVAPFIEEIVFRGYFFQAFSIIRSRRFAICLIASTFAFLHVGQYWGDWMAIVMVAMLGLVLTLFRHWTGTTTAGMIMHYVYNISVTIIPAVFLVIANPSYVEYQTHREEISVEKRIELLNKNIKSNPDFVEAYYELAAELLEQNKDLESAEKLISDTLTINPKSKKYNYLKIKIINKKIENEG